MSFTPTHLRQQASLSFSLFPSNLRFLRKRRGLNQEDISVLFNKKANTVGNWENGKTEPSIPELLVISGYFGVNLEDLLRSELRQQQAESERQLSLWPGTGERLGAIVPLAAVSEPARPAGFPVPPVPAGREPTAQAGVHRQPGTYNNEPTSILPERKLNPATPPAEVPTFATDSVPAGDAMWFMLRELRQVQERLDRLQLAFDQARTNKPADKSDH